MKIYPEEGFKIVQVSDTPPNKLYAFVDSKGWLVFVFFVWTNLFVNYIFS